MDRDPRAYLWDVRTALEQIEQFTAGISLEAYSANPMLNAAVERKFEIVGEALNQLKKVAPEIADRIPDLPRVVAFRNLLIHGYAAVNHARVWRTIQESLPSLKRTVDTLIGRTEAP